MISSELSASWRIMPVASRQIVTMTEATYAQLLAMADLAPLDALPIPQTYLQRASTMGYTRIGHVRLIPPAKLAEDLGEDASDAILGTLAASGWAELSELGPT